MYVLPSVPLYTTLSFIRGTNSSPAAEPDIPTTPTTILILLILRIFTTLSHTQLLRSFFLPIPITVTVIVFVVVLSDIAFAGLKAPFAVFFGE
jgi:hypothetical protein